MTRTQLEDFFVSIGEKKFRAAQIIKWIHQLGVDNFEEMSNVSKALRAKLADIAEIRPPEVVFIKSFLTTAHVNGCLKLAKTAWSKRC
jgi:23S rRNA (adenine2503-C2)-methyltransferase